MHTFEKNSRRGQDHGCSYLSPFLDEYIECGDRVGLFGIKEAGEEKTLSQQFPFPGSRRVGRRRKNKKKKKKESD